MHTPDLTAIDWTAYGVKGELPRLVQEVAKRTERGRDAWQARDVAKEAVARVDRDAAEAIRQAIVDDEPEPDVSEMRREREESHRFAQARAAGSNAAREDAERDVARFIAQEGDDDLEQVRAVLEERRARAVELAQELADAVADTVEAAALVTAMRDVEGPRSGMPRLESPKAWPVVAASAALVDEVVGVAPKPPRVPADPVTFAKARGW